MPLFELVIALLLAGAILSAWARHISVPYPTLLALAGAGLALMPHMPSVMLDPELALALFVAPVLLDAAFDSSPRDLKRHWRAVVGPRTPGRRAGQSDANLDNERQPNARGELCRAP